MILAPHAPALPQEATAALVAASWQAMGAGNKSDWQLLPYVQPATGSSPARVLFHALYLGSASGFQPAGSDVRLEGTTLELLVPRVAVKEMAVFSPAGPEAPGANSFANGGAGARLTLRDPPVFLVAELTVADRLPQLKSDDRDPPPLKAPSHLRWMSMYDFVPPQQQGWLNLGMNVVHTWPNASVARARTAAPSALTRSGCVRALMRV